jgi:hypothetical protein
VSEEVRNVAAPVTKLAEPATEPSILNCTLPVGAPAPGGTALRVKPNATCSPGKDGFLEELTIPVVPDFVMVSVALAELLAGR